MGKESKKNEVENDEKVKGMESYQWLENPQSAKAQKWILENQLSISDYLSNTSLKSKIKRELKDLWNYPKYFNTQNEVDILPQKAGKYYYFFKNKGLEHQPILYRTTHLGKSQLETVINPNKLNANGTVSISNLFFSKDGKMLAYAISIDGSDWQEIRILNLETLVEYKDVIHWCKLTTIAWAEDNSGFYYNCYPKPNNDKYTDLNVYNKLYWHKIGTNQINDVLIYEDCKNKDLTFHPVLSTDNKYLILQVRSASGSRNRIYYKNLPGDGDFQTLFDKNAFIFLGNESSIFYFYTNFNSPKGKVIKVDIHNPKINSLVDVIPESQDVIEKIVMVKNKIAVSYLHNAYSRLKVFDRDGTLEQEVKLPEMGTITGLSASNISMEFFYGFTSFLRPTTVYSYSLKEQVVTDISRIDNELIDIEDYEVSQHYFTTKEGAKIPLFIGHKKGITLDGQNKVLLHAYGGFNKNSTPKYSPSQLMWMNNGGIFVLAVLRGGGEFGEEWHQNGMGLNKQNVFNDFIASAEWLIKKKYTTPSKLVISGRSNGGLLVAVCMIQRPDLFGGVVCEVPVTDMLKFHHYTTGRYWIEEFGDIEGNTDDYNNLLSYSPIHNVENRVYPPILITTADTDDRVVPLHAKAFAAKLKEKQKGNNPILLRIEKNAGHESGKPVFKIINEQTDIYTFIYQSLNK